MDKEKSLLYVNNKLFIMVETLNLSQPICLLFLTARTLDENVRKITENKALVIHSYIIQVLTSKVHAGEYEDSNFYIYRA